MKRGGPIRRKTPLDGGKIEQLRKTAMKRTRINSKPKRRPRREQAAATAWREAVLRKPMTLPWDGQERVDAHHVITEQHLRKRGLDHLVYGDARNGMPVPRSIHARHTTARERIPRSALPPGALAFAAEHGLMDLIERYYP